MEDLLIEMRLDLIGVENGVQRVRVVGLHLTYCIPIAIILYNHRHKNLTRYFIR